MMLMIMMKKKTALRINEYYVWDAKKQNSNKYQVKFRKYTINTRKIQIRNGLTKQNDERVEKKRLNTVAGNMISDASLHVNCKYTSRWWATARRIHIIKLQGRKNEEPKTMKRRKKKHMEDRQEKSTNQPTRKAIKNQFTQIPLTGEEKRKNKMPAVRTRTTIQF